MPLENPPIISKSTWLNVTFSTGWSNFGSPFTNAQYCLDALGFVRFRGTIKSSSSTPPALIFTLPVGYRPEAAINMLVQSGNSNTSGGITIQTNGEVRNVTAPNPQLFVNLEQVCFYAA